MISQEDVLYSLQKKFDLGQRVNSKPVYHQHQPHHHYSGHYHRLHHYLGMRVNSKPACIISINLITIILTIIIVFISTLVSE